MKKDKNPSLTEWFSCRVKPVRKGWYECFYENDRGLPNLKIKRYWDGGKWTNPEAPQINGLCFFGTNREDKWRGLRRPA